jgi:RimJ/RimL family protein N-acetyltransferase
MVCGEGTLSIPEPVSWETVADVWLVGTILKHEQKYVGCCGLRAASEANATHLAYYFARPYWGRGLASGASTASIDLAFTRLQLCRLLADVDERNAVSRHIQGKFGFNIRWREELAASGRMILRYELRSPGAREKVKRQKNAVLLQSFVSGSRQPFPD